MSNNEIKNRIEKMNKNSKEILEVLLSDAILEMNCRHRVNEDILRRIVLVYLSLFDNKDYLKFEDLRVSEKSIICKIISKGIASIYLDDEYITNENSKDKLVIIDDMIDLLCFLTDFNRSTIKRLVIRDIKIYFYQGWRWDFI